MNSNKSKEIKKETEREKYLKWTLLPYFGSWVFGLLLVSLSSIGTYIVRKTIDPSLEIVSQNLLDFLIEFNSIYIYVPIAWLLGESGIRIMELFVLLKHKRN